MSNQRTITIKENKRKRRHTLKPFLSLRTLLIVCLAFFTFAFGVITLFYSQNSKYANAQLFSPGGLRSLPILIISTAPSPLTPTPTPFYIIRPTVRPQPTSTAPFPWPTVFIPPVSVAPTNPTATPIPNSCPKGYIKYGGSCKKRITGEKLTECNPLRFGGNKWSTILNVGKTTTCSFYFALDPNLSINDYARNVRVGLIDKIAGSHTIKNLSTYCFLSTTPVPKTQKLYKLTCSSIPTEGMSVGYHENAFALHYDGDPLTVNPQDTSRVIASDIQLGTCAKGGIYPQCTCPTMNLGFGQNYLAGPDMSTCYQDYMPNLCMHPVVQQMYTNVKNSIGFTHFYHNLNNQALSSGVSVWFGFCTSKELLRAAADINQAFSSPSLQAVLPYVKTQNGVGYFRQKPSPTKGYVIRLWHTYSGEMGWDWGPKDAISSGQCRGRVPVAYGNDFQLNWPLCSYEFRYLENGQALYLLSNFGDYTAARASSSQPDLGGDMAHELMHVLDGNSWYERDWFLNKGYAVEWQQTNAPSFRGYPNLQEKIASGWDYKPADCEKISSGQLPGFLNCYGTVDTLEDRAIFFSALMNEGYRESLKYAYQNDVYVRRKVRLLLNFLKREFNMDLSYITNGWDQGAWTGGDVKPGYVPRLLHIEHREPQSHQLYWQ